VPVDPTQSPTEALSERMLRPGPPAPGTAPASDAAAMGIAAGMSVGPYKLLQLIGEGGFGSVFMAEQSTPVHRRVALKIIKLGMDTRQVIARFEAERQALAMMDHPNIARVLDAGATDTGRPYFVMELVKGTPITKYADKERLTIPQRLDLFQQVCHAVQHAHTKGVMHRDLKPSNILVSTHDGKPFAKVIDFGIAKATDHRLTEKTLFTDFQAMIGTPEYMSPEQAEGSLDIDTRTDIYSLGVLLYELLCGVTPFDSRQLRSAAYAEMARIIREVEPMKPSTMVSTAFGGTALRAVSDSGGTGFQPVSADAPNDAPAQVPHHPQHRSETGATSATDFPDSLAKSRQTDLKSLTKQLKGDLDWIVMKALEKDRKRRYESASALSADIQRHLTGEAVLAAAPTVRYRMSKFARKNRAAVITIAAVALSLLIGTGVAVWGWIEANSALRDLHAANKVMERQGQLLQQFGLGWNQFQSGRQSDGIGNMRSAVVNLESLLGGANREVVAKWAHFGELMVGSGQFKEGMSAYQHSLDLRFRNYGEADVWTIGFHNQIAGGAGAAGDLAGQRRYLERGASLARAHLPPGDLTRTDVLWSLAWWYLHNEKSLALPAFQEMAASLEAETPQRLDLIKAISTQIDALQSEVSSKTP
jgi:serine/threonine protein kinase